MTKEELIAKLEELKKHRENLVHSANAQIANLSGRIEMLEELLKEEESHEEHT